MEKKLENLRIPSYGELEWLWDIAIYSGYAHWQRTGCIDPYAFETYEELCAEFAFRRCEISDLKKTYIAFFN